LSVHEQQYHLLLLANNLLPEEADSMTPPPPLRNKVQLLMIVKLLSPLMNDGPFIEEELMVKSPPATLVSDGT
jgi:hypothetical protein